MSKNQNADKLGQSGQSKQDVDGEKDFKYFACVGSTVGGDFDFVSSGKRMTSGQLVPKPKPGPVQRLRKEARLNSPSPFSRRGSRGSYHQFVNERQCHSLTRSDSPSPPGSSRYYRVSSIPIWKIKYYQKESIGSREAIQCRKLRH